MNRMHASVVTAAVFLALAGGVVAAKPQDQEKDSVFSWGRWKVLAPAAGQAPIRSPLFVVTDLGAGDADRLTPRVSGPQGDGGGGDNGEPPVPLPNVPCGPGAGCGFASFDGDKLVPGSAQDTGYFEIGFSRNDNDDRVGAAVVSLFSAGTVSYRASSADPQDGAPIDVSRTDVPVTFFPAAQGERFRAADGSISGSALPDADAPTFSAGAWQGDGHAGLYVWGVGATAAEIDAIANLTGGVALYQGHVGASGAGGTASLTMNFRDATWDGSFGTPGANFTASGVLDGPGFVSTQVGGDAVSGIVEGGLVDHGERAIGRFEIQDAGGALHRDIFNTVRAADVE